MKTKNRAVAALILYAITLGVNFMGSFGWINGMSQKDVSDKFPTLITPEPVAFAIWGLIYLAVILSLVLILKDHRKPWAKRAMRALAWPFYLSCLFNMAWIVGFSYEMLGISAILTLLLAGILAHLVERLRHRRKEALTLPAFAFGVYAGWSLIASVLNITAWLVKINWNRFGWTEMTWAVLILIVATGLTALIALRLKNAVFPLPVAWAYLHISLRHMDRQGFTDANTGIQWTALAGFIFLLLFAIYLFVANEKALFPRLRKYASESAP